MSNEVKAEEADFEPKASHHKEDDLKSEKSDAAEDLPSPQEVVIRFTHKAASIWANGLIVIAIVDSAVDFLPEVGFAQMAAFSGSLFVIALKGRPDKA